jgi:NAD(P)-dependent dehydrogenase (short-subunit alcohol dehydrogenase family)
LKSNASHCEDADKPISPLREELGMQGKVVVITGATSGVGRAGAEARARRGARIVFTARDAARAEETLAGLRAAGPSQAHRAVFGDLSVLADMKRVGAEIAASEPKIDVLANNAGAMFTKPFTTPDGLELTFALNHMSYFVITNALLSALKATPGARIISTSSSAHTRGTINFDTIGKPKGFTQGAYGVTKLCNILFTRELAKRLQGTGVTANCFHPGVVRSNFGAGAGPLISLILKLVQLRAITPEQGAETLVYLAASPEVANVSGRYFARSKEAPTAPAAQDDAAAARLWLLSEEIAAR